MDDLSGKDDPGLDPRLTPILHARRIALLMLLAAAVLGWNLRHTEASFADGLRSIQQAERIEQGAWRDGLVKSIDHPLHPLGLVAAHWIVGGEGPVSWQRAAVGLASGCMVLWMIPLYLLGLDLFGDRAALLGCLLVLANPLIGTIAPNVLTESSFLLFWTWGLWAAVRFLREGRFGWLPLAIGFGVLAYLSRPEGLLLPMALVATLGLLPMHQTTRIHWPRWWRAVAFVSIGSAALAGPFVAAKGSLATRPGLARVLGMAPSSPADALERERPLLAGQTQAETYRLALQRMLTVVRVVVTTPLLPFAILGLLVIPRAPASARTWMFLGLVLLASAFALVRLHATGGYCAPRHALVPGVLLLLLASLGLAWMAGRTSLDGRWFGRPGERLEPGPAVWAALLVLLFMLPRLNTPAQPIPGPFHVYRDAAAWLARNSRADEQVLDLTDWSLYLSQRSGYGFASLYEAPSDPKTRWLVVRRPHIDGKWNYCPLLRKLTEGRQPVALIPAEPEPGQLQVMIYDRKSSQAQVAVAPDDTQRPL